MTMTMTMMPNPATTLLVLACLAMASRMPLCSGFGITEMARTPMIPTPRANPNRPVSSPLQIRLAPARPGGSRGSPSVSMSIEAKPSTSGEDPGVDSDSDIDIDSDVQVSGGSTSPSNANGSTADNFDGAGFANYLLPYALALIGSILATGAMFKFVLLDY